MPRLPFFLAAMLSLSVPATAHEFWISPEDYLIAPDEQLTAHIRVGQDFKGGSYSYIPSKFARFDVVMGGQVTPVPGRIGDRPALAMAAPAEGLAIVVHQTGDMFLTYSDPKKFTNFVTEKDFTWALDEHQARGLPEKDFRERYSRFGKSLIAVGDGGGADARVGLLTEIVALANPYTDDLSSGLPVEVLYQDAPRADVQVEVFEKSPDGSVTKATYRTDAQGRATIAVLPRHEYLVDSVVMRPLEPVAENDPVWESLWASLTFLVPER